MEPRRHHAALAVSLALLTPIAAGAQTSGVALVGPIDRDFRPRFAETRAPNFQAPAGDLRQAGVPGRNGLIAAIPVRHNLEIGVGRFSVPEIARPRTYMEADRQPTAVRSRNRGIAAVGVSIRF